MNEFLIDAEVAQARLAASFDRIRAGIKKRQGIDAWDGEVDEIPAISPEPDNGLRAVPSAFLRSSLFAAIQSAGRQNLSGKALGAVQGIEIEFDGTQLAQSDLAVWLELTNLAQRQTNGTACSFTGCSLLRTVGDSIGQQRYKYLETVLRRFRSCGIVLSVKGSLYNGGLVEKWGRNEETRRYWIKLDSSVMRLFAKEGLTRIDVKQRYRLRKKPLAAWCHAFYSTHSEPFPYKVETIRAICGSNAREAWEFKRHLKVALADVAEVTGWQCELGPTDLVTVSKRRGG